MAFRKQDHRLADDQELLKRYYHDGDKEWLGMLLERYTLLLYGVCMKYLKNEEDARDSVQQVFVKVLDDLHKYQVSFFKSWLYMVAKNHCLMKLRSRGYSTGEISEKLAESNADDDRQAMLEKDRNLDLLAEAIKHLNPEQQLCITLFYLEKKSYQEVADQSGFSMLQVKSHIQNGKRNLKIFIQRMQQNE